jgi:hypothetical protein
MIEDRRNQLASIIIALADNGMRDLAQIKEVAVLVMMHPDEAMQFERTNPANLTARSSRSSAGLNSEGRPVREAPLLGLARSRCAKL